MRDQSLGEELFPCFLLCLGKKGDKPYLVLGFKKEL